MFKFTRLGIPTGATLQFVGDPTITATVISESQVRFDGKAMSLSGAALEVLSKMGKPRRSIQGPKMWTWNGIPLTEIDPTK